ncbi:MAG: 4Fe-4S binding protein [Thermodesulfovibrionales bacterium]|jgi:NAD-dependent dihydropyrimidine dehydrogenase PreA subunit
MYMVSINASTCTGCEECVNICPQSVFRMLDGKSDPYQTAECVFCQSCLGVCPTESITINEM